jgi:hypothetical protein
VTRVLLFALAAVLTAPPAVAPELRTVLLRDFKFTPQDIGELEQGQIIKRALGSASPGEIAVAGATRVDVPKEILVERFRDIVHFKSGPDVLQIGRFGSPPSVDDLAALSIDRADFDGRDCRVGDCDVRLPAASIQRFQEEINWAAPDAASRAAALFKQMIVDNVRAYLTGAPGRFTQYDDDKRPIRPVDEFNGLLRNFAVIGALAPELPGYLERFPASPLTGGEDFLYWSKEKVAGMPFITVTHVTIAPGAGGSIVIASKDVYSSRYFDTSLGVTIASDAAGSDAHRAFYLVYANRARASALKGMLGGLRRTLVERRAKSSLDDNLKNVKLRLENGR